MSVPETELAPQEQNLKLTAHHAGELAGSVKTLIVHDQQTRALAANLRSQIKAVQKAAKATYIAITKPLSDTVAMWKARFEPINAALEEALEGLDKKITADHDEQKRIADEARRKAEDEAKRASEAAEARAREEREREARAVAARAQQEALEAGMSKKDACELAKLERADVEARPLEVGPIAVAAYIPPPAKTVQTPTSKTTVAEVWDYELEDLSKVPPIYVRKELDRGRVRCAVNDGVREIPGIRIFSKGRVSG